MADSQDKQKEQADAKSRSCNISYKVGDQVLLNAKNLPTNLVSAVFKTKLRPRFIGPFTIVAKKGLAYTLNLPRKLRTHPVFYVGLLKPYRNPSHVDWTALAPRKVNAPLVVASAPRCLTDPLSEAVDAPTSLDGFGPLQKSSQSKQHSREGVAPRASEHQMLPARFRTPLRYLTRKGISSLTWGNF